MGRCRNAAVRAVAMTALAMLVSAGASAQPQPVCSESVLRIVVPFPPGGPTDVAARVLAEKLRDRLGQNVIVESRAGAAGATGTAYVASMPGNGCTMLLAYDTHAVNPSLLQLPFDTATAFKPVILIGIIPNMIAAHPSQPWNSFPDMVAAAKKDPDNLAYATGGSGTVAHMSMKLVEQHFGIRLRQVPYRGGAPAAQDLLAGHVPMMVGSVTALGGFVKDGKARALVQTGTTRHPLLPDTPTLSEVGMKDFQAAAWIGIFVPSASADPIVTRFNSELKTVLQDSWVRERLAAVGVQIVASTPEELGAHVKSEMTRWADVVTRYNIKAE